MDQGFAEKDFRFIELDLDNVVKRKIKKIKGSKKINQLFERLKLKPNIAENSNLLSLGDKYAIASCDLSDLAQFRAAIESHKINPKLPTFFYAECVLSYINADRVDDLMGFINQNFNLGFVFDYEMYNPNDRFGQMMVKNFDNRGCPLVGIYKYQEIRHQHERYTKNGFKNTEVYTMKEV